MELFFVGMQQYSYKSPRDIPEKAETTGSIAIRTEDRPAPAATNKFAKYSSTVHCRYMNTVYHRIGNTIAHRKK